MTDFVQTTLLYLKANFVAVSSAANESTKIGINIPGATRMTAGGYSSWQNYLSDIYGFALDIGFSLAVLMIVYSAILYLTSQGDSSKINTAKEFTMGALVGLAMLYMVGVLAKLLGIQGIK